MAVMSRMKFSDVRLTSMYTTYLGGGYSVYLRRHLMHRQKVADRTELGWMLSGWLSLTVRYLPSK